MPKSLESRCNGPGSLCKFTKGEYLLNPAICAILYQKSGNNNLNYCWMTSKTIHNKSVMWKIKSEFEYDKSCLTGKSTCKQLRMIVIQEIKLDNRDAISPVD